MTAENDVVEFLRSIARSAHSDRAERSPYWRAADEIERLRKLRGFVMHLQTCDAMNPRRGDVPLFRPCSCGLDKLVRPADDVSGEVTK